MFIRYYYYYCQEWLQLRRTSTPGVWRKGNGSTYLWAGVSWADFNKKWSELAKQNLRLIDIETYETGGKRYFSGVWEGGSDGYALTPAGLDWAAFNKFWTDYSKTLRLIATLKPIPKEAKDTSSVYSGKEQVGMPLRQPVSIGQTSTSFGVTTVKIYGLRILRPILKEVNDISGVFNPGNDGYVLSPYGMTHTVYQILGRPCKREPAIDRYRILCRRW